MLTNLFDALRQRFRRRQFRVGATLTRFVAKDIRRDVEVVEASELDRGVITARICTWNVLYAVKGLVPEPAFSEPRQIELEHLWQWSGAPWGGPVPSEGVSTPNGDTAA